MKKIRILIFFIFIMIYLSNKTITMDAVLNKSDNINEVNKLYLNTNYLPSIFLQEIKENKSLYILNKINYYKDKVYISISKLNKLLTRNSKKENYIDLDENLYISTIYTNPDLDIKEDVILKFYATDYNHSAYMEDDYSQVFKIILNLNGEISTFYKNIGESILNIGKQEVGEYKYTIQAIDVYGRKSPELYGEFRVEDKIKKEKEIKENTYYVTNKDLINYGISNNNESNKSHQTKVGLQNLINKLSAKGIRKCVLPKGIYSIDSEYNDINGVQSVKNVINIPSNFILDLNGSILKQDTTSKEQSKGYMLSIDNSYDAHVTNGIIEGDYGDRDLTSLENGNPSGEQVGFGIISGNSKYSSFNNLTVRKISGYALSVGLSISGEHALSSWNGLQGWENIDINKEGNEEVSDDKYTCDYYDLSDYHSVDTLRTGKYLGYQFSQDGDDWVVKYHFYDKNKSYIKTTVGHQYRVFIKPQNAKYMRVTYTSKDISNLQDLQVYHMYTPINCIIKDIDFEDTRTCALNPNQGNNILIENCTFKRCATNITPVAIDFEDGWNLMQDYCVRNNEVIEQVGTSDIVVVGGMNLQFEKNKNFRFSNRGCTPGTVIRDNEDLVGGLNITSRLNSGYYRYYNNKNVKSVGNIDSNDLKYIIYNCTFFETPAGDKNKLIEFVRCTFDWNYKNLPFNTGGIIAGNFKDCIIKNYIDKNNNFIHLNDAYFENCVLKNIKMNINGDFKVNNSNIKNVQINNYVSNINMQIKNSKVKNFNFNFIEWAKCSYNIKFENTEFENNYRKNILDDSFIKYNGSALLKINNINNIYKNNTILINNEVLSNPKIKILNSN